MVYFISYPKSGRTWLRKLIDQYAVYSGKKPVAYKFTHAGFSVNPDRDSIKSINARLQGKNSNDKVVVLSRGVADTIVSYYDDCCKRYIMYKGTVSEFIRDNDVGLPNIIKYYIALQEIKEIEIAVSYEQLKTSPIETLTPIIKLLFDGKPNNACIKKTIEYCSFDNLYTLERKKEIDMRNDGFNNFYKTRKGKIGSAREELTPVDFKYIRHNTPEDIHRYIGQVKVK